MRKLEFLEWKHWFTHFHTKQQQWLTLNRELMSLVVAEVQADTIRAVFGHSGCELEGLQPEDFYSKIIVKKATEDLSVVGPRNVPVGT